MKVLIKSVVCAISSLFFFSCATSQNTPPRFDEMLQQATGQNGRACVKSMDIDGYGVLKQKVISIDGGRKYYLATLFPGCIHIDTSISALFAGNFGEVCGGGRDKILTRGDSCGIQRMFEFESREQAFELYNKLLAERKEMQEAARTNE